MRTLISIVDEAANDQLPVTKLTQIDSNKFNLIRDAAASRDLRVKQMGFPISALAAKYVIPWDWAEHILPYLNKMGTTLNRGPEEGLMIIASRGGISPREFFSGILFNMNAAPEKYKALEKLQEKQVVDFIANIK